MHRAIAIGAAVLAGLTLAGCGRTVATAPTGDSATLAAYVMDSPPPSPGRSAAAAGSACARGQDAYEVLLFLASADTGTSVSRIAGDLRAGRTLNEVAGARAGQVTREAMDLVLEFLRFAVANGKVTVEEAQRYGAAAAVVITALMAANVSSCVPAAG